MIRDQWASEDGRVRLYCGDCLEVLAGLPAGSIDAVLTDPPYCSGGYLEAQRGGATAQGLRSEVTRREGFRWFAADNMSTGGLIWLLRAVLVECRRLLAPQRSALLFADWRMVPMLAQALESSGLRYRNQIIWDKGSAGLGTGFRATYEAVLEFANGNTAYGGAGENVVRCGRVPAAQKEHGAQKPVGLLVALLRVLPPGPVLDPFMGSGSTGVAALAAGRPFVGVELDPDHYATARDRIEAELDRYPLLERPRQLSLLDEG